MNQPRGQLQFSDNPRDYGWFALRLLIASTCACLVVTVFVLTKSDDKFSTTAAAVAGISAWASTARLGKPWKFVVIDVEDGNQTSKPSAKPSPISGRIFVMVVIAIALLVCIAGIVAVITGPR